MNFAGLPDPLLVLGCGNMGGAMVAGLIAGGGAPSRFHVLDPHAAVLPAGAVRLTADEAPARYQTALLAIKPQMLDALTQGFLPLLARDAVVISVLAGVRIERLRAVFPGRRTVRLMPNLAAAIGKSPMVLYGDDLNETERVALTGWLSACGPVSWLEDEELMDVVTALVGSGPAFLYRFIDGLTRAAAALGLPADQAQAMALATVEGAAALASASPDSPRTLADRVASPGGSTREGLDVLDHNNALTTLLEATLRAARDRNIALAGPVRD